MVDQYQSEDLRQVHTIDRFKMWPWLLHGYTTRHFSGNSQSHGQSLLKLADYYDLQNPRVVYPEQIHSNKIKVLVELTFKQMDKDQQVLEIPGADALITTLPNTMIAIKASDCVPLMFVDPLERIIAVAHAGWKGTLGRIGEGVIQELVRLGSRTRHIYMYIGPCISGENYPVGEQRLELFKQHFPDNWHQFIDGDRLDLPKCNELIALKQGLVEENISRSPYCTFDSSDVFHSYRAADFNLTGSNYYFLMIQN